MSNFVGLACPAYGTLGQYPPRRREVSTDWQSAVSRKSIRSVVVKLP